MKLKVYPKSPAPRHIQQIVETLKSGGVVIIPTDSVYAYACMSTHPEAVKKLATIKGVPVEKAHFSFMFSDMTMVAEYSKQLSNDVFKLMKRLLPGPFTFIVNAGSKVSKIIPNKKTLGVRIPNNQIPLQVVQELGVPLLTTSVYDDDTIIEYTTDPVLIAERHEKEVAMIVDGGYGHNEPSTVLDCTGDQIILIRKGLGEVEVEEVA